MDNHLEQEEKPCGYPDPAYVASTVREKEEKDNKILVLTPWTVQSICFEVLKNYMTDNSPQQAGYKFSQSYDPDDFKSEIALEIAYHYKDAVIQKRPGIYVSRGETMFSYPTINQTIASNPRESEKTKLATVQMPVNFAVVATNVGFAEQLAEYVFKVFLYFQELIRNDFCLRQFKLVSLGPPSLYLESKDHFLVNVMLQVAFDMGTVIKGDHLKIKTISHTVFTNCAEQPLENQ